MRTLDFGRSDARRVIAEAVASWPICPDCGRPRGTLDLFAGPGGWDEGLLRLGVEAVLGVEYDDSACATRRAAGHATMQADVSRLEPEWFDLLCMEGFIASPPCQMFSQAGKGTGRLLIAELLAALTDAAQGRYHGTIARHRRRMARTLMDPGSGFLPKATRAERAMAAWRTVRNATLVVEPARFIYETRPERVALEQVPAVLPVWRHLARLLGDLGYRTWAGELNAADFGVPQLRRRAVFMAHRDRPVAPPEPSHAQGGSEETLFGPALPPWVTMAEALGWGLTSRPSTAVVAGSGRTGAPAPLDGGAGSRQVYRDAQEEAEWADRSDVDAVGFPRRDDRGTSPDGYRERDWHPVDGPSATVTEKARSWTLRTGRNTMKHSRRVEDMVPHEVNIDDRPAPTVTSQSGAWKVAEEGAHVDPPMRWKVNTGRDWKAGGSREDAQTFDALTEPARTIDGKGRWHVEVEGLDPSEVEIVGAGGTNATVRGADEPAPTVAFGHDAAAWKWRRRDASGGQSEADPDWPMDRPATTIAGRGLVADPGATANRFNGKGKSRNDGYRVTLEEVSVLQDIRPDYPWQGSSTKRYEQVGNMVPPGLAAAVWSVLL